MICSSKLPATAANQTREPVRIEEERPFPAMPAFKFRNELDEETTSGEQDNLGIKSLKRFVVTALSFWGN